MQMSEQRAMGPLAQIPRIAATGGPYLRNCWYAAMWADDLGETPQARVFLEEPVALFRDGAGGARAIAGRCPHRFAALGHGRVVDGALECPYHGLRFDGAGTCVFSPHGDGRLPDAYLHSYPLVERHGLLWIWMGDPVRADCALIPDFGWLADGQWDVVRGATLAEGHYELYSDNILDLSHANFIHPGLEAAVFTSGERRFWQDGGKAYAEYVAMDVPISPNLAMMMGVAGLPQDFYGRVEWNAPAVLFFDYRAGNPGTAREACHALPSLHAFTPETADTTHYLWATGRQIARGDATFSAALRHALATAFEAEDMPVIRDCHRLMKGGEFWSLRPVILEGDGGGVRARRLLRQMIAREASPGKGEGEPQEWIDQAMSLGRIS